MQSSTEVARVTLAAGSLDALRAVRLRRPFPPHFHETFAIGVVERGATRLVTHRGEWVAPAGAILAFSPEEIHAADASTADGYSYRMVYPSREFLGEVARLRCSDPERPLFDAPVLHDPPLARDLLAAQAALLETGGGAAEEARLVGALRTLVARHSRGGGVASASRAVDLALVERVRAILDARFNEPIRLSVLAEACGVSECHLVRVFRRIVGLPPYAYLLQRRVIRAQAMLSAGQPVTDVAYACGFADQSHLTRLFRKAVGVTPGQWRSRSF